MENEGAYLMTEKQVNRVREIYSRIGEPLPADIIADLYRHLESVQRAAAPAKKKQPRTKTRKVQ